MSRFGKTLGHGALVTLVHLLASCSDPSGPVKQPPPTNQRPVASASPVQPSIYVGQEALATFSCNDPDGAVISHSWNPEGSIQGNTAHFKPGTPGTFKSMYHCVDDDGASSEAVPVEWTVKPRPLSSASALNPKLYVGETALATFSCDAGDNAVQAHVWEPQAEVRADTARFTPRNAGTFAAKYHCVNQAGISSDTTNVEWTVAAAPTFAQAAFDVVYLIGGGKPNGEIQFESGKRLSIQNGRAHLSATDSIVPGLHEIISSGDFPTQRRVVDIPESGTVSFDVIDPSFDYNKHLSFLGTDWKRAVQRPVEQPTVFIYDVTPMEERDEGYHPVVVGGAITEDSIAKLRMQPEHPENIRSVWREDVPLYTPFRNVAVVQESTCECNMPDLRKVAREEITGRYFYFSKVNAMFGIDRHDIHESMESDIIIAAFHGLTPGKGNVYRAGIAIDTNQSLGWDNDIRPEELMIAGEARPNQFLIDSGKILYGRPVGSGARELGGVLIPDYIQE